MTTEENVARVREAYAAYTAGDTAALLDMVDPDLEWTYLDPATANPSPQTCHGRGELKVALARQAVSGLRMQLEEIVGHDDKVVVSRAHPRCRRPSSDPGERPQLRGADVARRSDRRVAGLSFRSDAIDIRRRSRHERP